MGLIKHCFIKLIPKHNVYYKNVGWKGPPSDNLVQWSPNFFLSCSPLLKNFKHASQDVYTIYKWINTCSTVLIYYLHYFKNTQKGKLKIF